MSGRQRVAVLGTSGSIGANTLDVIRENPQSFELFAVTAHRNLQALVSIIAEFRPRIAVVSDADAGVQGDDYALLRRVAEDAGTDLIHGSEGLVQVASMSEVDIVVAGIVGAAGLASVFAAARQGKRILLANKEALVMSGAVLMDTVVRYGATLLPIDSEHNAIFQCLPDQLQRAVACKAKVQSSLEVNDDVNALWNGISRVHLTASGGPFRGRTRAMLAQVTPEEACKHPNWQMGQKISIDSATLMNKGLELIEACWLFDLKPSRINVVIHPESIIHSMVEFVDGSVLAQLGAPDMKTPIASALGWPARIASRSARLDLFALNGLHFEAPDHAAFPCLGLAGQAFEAGGAAPAVLNAANEVAVAAFIAGRIGFLDISKVIQASLDSCIIQEASTLEAIVEADARSRVCADELVRRFS